MTRASSSSTAAAEPARTSAKTQHRKPRVRLSDRCGLQLPVVQLRREVLASRRGVALGAGPSAVLVGATEALLGCLLAAAAREALDSKSRQHRVKPRHVLAALEKSPELRPFFGSRVVGRLGHTSR